MVYEAIKGLVEYGLKAGLITEVGKTGIINSKFGRNRRPVI